MADLLESRFAQETGNSNEEIHMSFVAPNEANQYFGSYFREAFPAYGWKDEERRGSGGSFRCDIASAKIWSLLLSGFIFLIPSFLSSRHSKGHSIRNLASTAWLDGLRGIACLIVFVFHFQNAYFSCWGDTYVFDGTGNSYFLQLPIIYLLRSGPPMVHIFFIISGFALSYKSVKLMRKPVSHLTSHAILSNIASSIYKRYLRLILPCGGIFILVICFTAAGWYEPYARLGFPTANVEVRPPLQESLYAQIKWGVWDFYEFSILMSLVFVRSPYWCYSNPHMWTIPTEFKQSLYLFLSIVGMSHLKRWLRVKVILPGLVMLALHQGIWQLSLFHFGFFLAEIHTDIIATQEDTPLSEPGSSLPICESPRLWSNRSLELLKRHGPTTLFFIGLYLCSYPENIPDTNLPTGFGNLTLYWTPSSYTGLGIRVFWRTLGAQFICFALLFMPSIQSILCTRFPQYMGRISFALYLVHGAINKTLGYHVVDWGWEKIGVNAIWEHDLQTGDKQLSDLPQSVESMRIAVVISTFLFIVGPITICVADVFWRVFDAPSVKFVRWLEGKSARN
ncbi:hypothetical protein ABW20_dc0108707 [Dactylellina cionopaga]|nr:hypothetical protein ABW20_dc0108707 [Dactylellina cionopaga]